MAYIYQADVWCDKCGEHICAEITREGKAPEDIEDKSSYDSDEFPKQYDPENEESDGPDNCASGNCAGMTDGQNYGVFLRNQLTAEGYKYLKTMLDGHGHTLPEFAKEWAESYGFEYHDNPWSDAHSWLDSKPICDYLRALLDKLDGDTIQDAFQNEMEEDGYFKETGWYSDQSYE